MKGTNRFTCNKVHFHTLFLFWYQNVSFTRSSLLIQLKLGDTAAAGLTSLIPFRQPSHSPSRLFLCRDFQLTKEMVMEKPSAQLVGREFVRQYYTLLNQAPDYLHR